MTRNQQLFERRVKHGVSKVFALGNQEPECYRDEGSEKHVDVLKSCIDNEARRAVRI